NDDWNLTRQSQVRFIAAAGTTYYIRVDSYYGDQGPISLNYALDTTPPPNDNFADATSIYAGSGTVLGSGIFGDNCNATTEPGEPPAHGSTVWWRWTAPTTGCYTFNTADSSFMTFLEVFTGGAVDSLTRVAYSAFAPSGSRSLVSFHAD